MPGIGRPYFVRLPSNQAIETKMWPQRRLVEIDGRR